jgi:hypothetical protein
MPTAHSHSDHTSLICNNEGSARVGIPSTGRPIGGLQLDLSAFNTETHTYEGRAASERFEPTREEATYA